MFLLAAHLWFAATPAPVLNRVDELWANRTTTNYTANARKVVEQLKPHAKDFEAALQGWISLLEDSPTDASWIPLVRRDILNMAAFLGRDPDTILPDLTPAERARSQPKAAQAPADHGLTTEDMQMAADMDEASRNEMVEGMVASLAERLSIT